MMLVVLMCCNNTFQNKCKIDKMKLVYFLYLVMSLGAMEEISASIVECQKLQEKRRCHEGKDIFESDEAVQNCFQNLTLPSDYFAESPAIDIKEKSPFTKCKSNWKNKIQVPCTIKAKCDKGIYNFIIKYYDLECVRSEQKERRSGEVTDYYKEQSDSTDKDEKPSNCSVIFPESATTSVAASPYVSIDDSRKDFMSKSDYSCCIIPIIIIIVLVIIIIVLVIIIIVLVICCMRRNRQLKNAVEKESQQVSELLPEEEALTRLNQSAQ